MKKTKLVTMLGAVALIGAIGVGSTFAYLTSTTGTVTNTFTVGNVSFDETFGNGLTESAVIRYDEKEVPETAVVPENVKKGQYIDADGISTWSATKNKYTELVAGEVVYKDPTAHMGETSQDAYLFIRVYNTEKAKKVNDKDVKYFENFDIDSNKWEKIGSGEDYIDYALKDTAKAGEHYTLFEHVTLGNISSGDTIPDITVKACAVQHAGFDSAAQAYKEAVWEK